jgi:hypothetical protein
MNFASLARTRTRRRGIILVVILGMLGLLALIGVTFATFSGQAQVNARNFQQSKTFPDASELMDFALSQLIADTANPASVIRGHSLLRDMYGNDAQSNGPLLTYNPDSTDGTGLFGFTGVPTYIQLPNSLPPLLQGSIKYVTNIPVASETFYGMNFTRWTVRFNAAAAAPAYLVGRSLEVLYDDQTGPTHVFYVAPVNGGLPIPPTPPPTGPAFRPGPDPGITWPPGTLYVPSDPSYAGITGSTLIGSSINNTTVPPSVISTNNLVGIPFALDGRYLHAFNGPGIASLGNDAVGSLQTPPNSILNRSLTEYSNFRYNGNIFNNTLTRNPGMYSPSYFPGYGDPSFLGDPNFFPMPGMDEDYDACDLENWFLAIQSADGQVVVPSFHRPGILTARDWTSVWNPNDTTPLQAYETRAMSRILRPRQADGHSAISFPDLVPQSDGKIVYDVDNDGDGNTDAVWLDLGYPPRRNAEGKLYKPLFAFTVIGLNGKLPLNTAGNLQKGQITSPDHAEHLGFSPSEVDLRFALQNGMDVNNNAVYQSPSPYAGHFPNEQFDNANLDPPPNRDPNTLPATPHTLALPVNVAQTQLRNLLCGTRLPDSSGTGTKDNGDNNKVMVKGRWEDLPNGVLDFYDYPIVSVSRSTNTVAGRWGEDEFVPAALAIQPTPFPLSGVQTGWTYTYTNLIRAGRSVNAGPTSLGDSRDDNYNGFDMFPMPYIPPLASPLPTPPTNTPEMADYYDPSGSLALPVERLRRFVMPFDLFGSGRIVTPLAIGPPKITGADVLGRVWFQGYYRPPGLAIKTGYTVGNETQPASLGIDPITSVAYVPEWPNYTNNRYHGFTSQMTPSATNALNNDAATPSDILYQPPNPPIQRQDANGTLVQAMTESTPTLPVAPTFDLNVLSTAGRRQMASGNKAVGEADEMNLYAPSRFDAPFGPSDLEWLYRAQDVDGSSLQSRLKDLAPISLVKSIDATRRRRLFALDTWDLTTFSWANDNPQNTFPTNSHFARIANGGYQSLGAATPSIAQGDQRINLNFPLPVSNSPVEPVRQKWIRETYQLLKAVLPPKAVDTPEELAQLSQYVVNMVDFRDPDCTMTRFVNTDVWVIEPADVTTQATLAFPANVLPTPPLPLAIAYDVTYLLPTPTAGVSNPHYLVQYGMEYQPVAINEVMALRFETNNSHRPSPGPPTPPTNTLADPDYVSGFFVELVNTLTKDAITAPGANSSDLDLAGWDLVIMSDDGLGRPDQITGQLPLQDATKVVAYSLRDGTPTTGTNTLGVNGPNGVPALQSTNDVTNYPVYLMGGMTVDTNTANGYGLVMSPNQPLLPGAASRWAAASALMQQVKSLKENSYYWVYLRRPPNPFDLRYDTTNPNSNRVVVDSFRFVYTTSTGAVFSQPAGTTYTATYSTNGNPVTNKDQTFSLQRMQPFRGGHAVPPLAGVAGKYVTPAYGYTEQTSVPATSLGNIQGIYQESGAGNQQYTTSLIYQTLGAVNTPGDLAWDYFPFNDRDYVSVVEILNVPGCSPGLFTKQFAEAAPPIAGVNPVPAVNITSASYWTTQTLPPANLPVWNAIGWMPAQFTTSSFPHTMPYLNDEFFYTGMSEPTPGLSPPAWPDPTLTTPPTNTNPKAPVYSNFVAGVPTAYIGGPGGAGWHKMLEFFEVPSPMLGAIGPVAQGANYDWLRQDIKPGQLNLNLIIDEEVFLGLMGESVYGSPFDLTNRSGVLNQWQCLLNVNPTGAATPLANQPPAVVTQVDDYGAPALVPNPGAYTMSNTGASDIAPGFNGYNTTGMFTNYLKACFADFLKLRHGGSGYVFGWGNGPTGTFGQPFTPGTLTPRWPIASDRPYRSLSYPDINYTIMRPANLSPAPPYNPTNPTTIPVDSWYDATTTPATYHVPAWSGANGTPPGFAQDPGWKSPYLFTQNNPVQPAPNPPRRLFQIADRPSFHGNASTGNCFLYPNTPGVPNWFINTTTGGTLSPTVTSPTPFPPPLTVHTGTAAINSLVVDNTDVSPTDPTTRWVNPYRITNPNMDLVAPVVETMGDNNYLGGANSGNDQRDHPYFRTEWMQKMVNLTTVRTHQYAVWITVGFFEVTRAGDPQLANVPFNSGNRLDAQGHDKAYDILGLELDALAGRNVRYRGFFLVDRTKAVGFNPALPGDFRSCVVYRQRIE